MRKRYDKDFKAKVALEALRGERTIQEIGSSYGVHPNLVSVWKKELLENAGQLFETKGKDKGAEATAAKMDELYRQIGQLQVEKDFLKKKYKQLYGTEPPM
jgi:transposase-like protein